MRKIRSPLSPIPLLPDEWLRAVAFSMYSRIRGSDFGRELWSIDNCFKSDSFLHTWREERLRDLLSAAQQTVHYREYVGLPIDQFPVLGKVTIKELPERFLNASLQGENLVRVATSGSYGVPLSFWLTRQKKLRQRAEVVYFGRWAGYEIGMRHLYARAYNPKSRLSLALQNEVFAYTDHPVDEWLDTQIAVLRKKRLRAIIGFPAPIYLIALRASNQGLGPADFDVEAVITTGEKLRDDQRSVIEAAFGATCLSRYSSEELGVLANECPEEHLHHVNDSSYIVEVLRLDSDEPAEPGEVGRVVVTDLFSHAMPLIRYDTGDLSSFETHCLCGRGGTVLSEIHGRLVEIIYDAAGRPVTPYFINPIMKDYAEVRQFQFAQVGEGSYEMRLVGSPIDTSALRARLGEHLGKNARVSLNYYDEIPSLPSGKRPYVVNEWKATRG